MPESRQAARPGRAPSAARGRKRAGAGSGAGRGTRAKARAADARPPRAKRAPRKPRPAAKPKKGTVASTGVGSAIARHGLRGVLAATTEGRLLRVGLLGLALLVAELVVLAVLVPEWAGALLSMVSVELFTGREGAIPLGLAGGTPAWLVAQVSATQDLVAVALVYPLFLYAIERFHDRDNLLMRRIRRIDEAASRHRVLVDRWGAFGLAAFMLVPFLVNGPLVGAIAGRLAGMRVRALIAPVVGATVVASLAWSYFYKGMQNLFPDLDPRWSILVTVVVVGLALGVSALVDWRDRRKAARAARS